MKKKKYKKKTFDIIANNIICFREYLENFYKEYKNNNEESYFNTQLYLLVLYLTELFDKIPEKTQYYVLSQFLKDKNPYKIMKDHKNNSYLYQRLEFIYIFKK